MKPSIWVLRVASAPPAFVVSPRSVVRGVFCSVPHAEWLRQHWPLLLLPLLLLLHLDSLLHYRLVLLNILEKEAVKNMYVPEFNKLNLQTQIVKDKTRKKGSLPICIGFSTTQETHIRTNMKQPTFFFFFSSFPPSRSRKPFPRAHQSTQPTFLSPLLAPTHLPPATDTSSHR